jgi:hypothetical protein
MKKYLVTDYDINNSFQYMIVKEYEDDLKLLYDYQSIKVTHSRECYEIILELMIKNDIDELMINNIGIVIAIVDELKQNLNLYNKTIICHNSILNNHNKILDYLNDLRNNKLALTSNTYILKDYINIDKINMSVIHTTNYGYLKIDKLVDYDYRKILHLILTLYGCLRIFKKQKSKADSNLFSSDGYVFDVEATEKLAKETGKELEVARQEMQKYKIKMGIESQQRS